jgi:hypothetical protein
MKVESIGKLFALGAMMGLVAIAPVRADDDEETPLGEQMEDVSRALKGLRKAPDFAAKAELARKGQTAVINSLKYLPVMFEGMKDEKVKTKATADFKRMMGQALMLFAELELAFLEEDEDKADEVVDKLKDLKKEGHNAYVEDE